MSRLYRNACTFIIMFFFMSSVHAAIVHLQVTGEVQTAISYGTLPNSCPACIIADLVYDDTSIVFSTGGGGESIATIDFSTGSSNTLSINAGGNIFDQTMDIDGVSEIVFTNGDLTDFNYSAEDGTQGDNGNGSYPPETFDSFNLIISASDIGILVGQWNVAQLPAVVPVPAAAWLFGTGLIGLIGIARRKTV